MCPSIVPPSLPEDVHVVKTDNGQISISWDPPKDLHNAYTPVNGYIIEMATGVKDNFVEVGRVDGHTCNFKATGLKNGKKYNFRVRAHNSAGISSAYAQLDKPAIATPSVGRYCVGCVGRHLFQITCTYMAPIHKL